MSENTAKPPFPGIPEALDGTAAVVAMEVAASEAAGAYPITPATNMGEGWAVAYAQGVTNVNGRRLIFFEPEGEHAAAGVTAGMSMVGLRSANFSAGQGIAYMHESLYAAVGKRLTYVLNIACRAMTKHSLNIHAGHDDYHAVDDTGFFQVIGKNAQEAADLNLIAHRIAELSLNPGICGQDGFLTSHVIETLLLPERELIKQYLGDPSDIIDSPTPAQRLVFGDKRRRIPELFDIDNPACLGTVQNQDSYAQGVAAQRPFYFDHIPALADQAFAEYAALTGRQYGRLTGYRVDDAEYVLAGQGSIVWNMEAAADYLRSKGIKVGVINVTMFRPFPADLFAQMLGGKKAVTVLERLDQPLAVDLPVVREIRAALGKAVENGRAKGSQPHAGIPALQPDQVPDVYSGSFGMGSRDTQPGDIIAAVENMMPKGKGQRFFYLGMDFIREETHLPKLKVLQDTIQEGYPGIGDLALKQAENANLLPEGSLALRIHSVGGWGAITTGKNLAMTLFDLLGLQVKANPKYGSEKKGQPTTFYATFAHAPLRLNCDLSHVDVVLSPDPNVFGHSNPFAGMPDGGVFVVQSDLNAEQLWASLPAFAKRNIAFKKLKVYYLDAFKVAREEASNPDLEFRMQGAVFQGAFFRTSPLMAREGLDEAKLFEAIRAQLKKKFGKLGERVIEDNFRVIRRGYDEVKELDWVAISKGEKVAAEARKVPEAPHQFSAPTGEGIADVNRFFDQVGAVYASGEEPIADPFGAISAIPAVTGPMRDMTAIRFEIPELIPDRCTGCGQCWAQCPDSAIPGLVTEIDQLLETAHDASSSNGHPGKNLRPHLPALSDEVRKVLKDRSFTRFVDTLSEAWRRMTLRLDLEPPKQAALDEEIDGLKKVLADFPVTKAKPFFDIPESRDPKSGGLLSITVNPQTCKGCMLCVDVCPDNALSVIKQGKDEIERLRRNWKFWEKLPDTPDRFVNVTNLDEGIGVLNTLLLKRKVFNSMVGGDGACMGCGEKTTMHLTMSAIEAAMQPRVTKFVTRLEEVIKRLDERARLVLAGDANFEALWDGEATQVAVPVTEDKKARLTRISKLLHDLKALRRRYTEGRGRAACGMTNSTGCSSVWGSTYPFNPYPYPWVNHLFQDAPSIAIGIFEGVMRKMADGFAAVRRAELEIDDKYDPAVHDTFFEAFDYEQFTDEEFRLCPPIVAVGGDGAMLDIGFQNLSRLMASGKPLRVIVLDTQVYSNTGGQACTSGFTGQVSDLAWWGKAQHGKTEQRKELSLISIAHRTTFVLQSSQASPAHLLGGVLRGVASRHPAVFILHAPCMPEHGITDDAAERSARLALEARAMPFLVYDPDGGPSIAERLDLGGNPSLDEVWPTYDLNYEDEDGNVQTMTLPMTSADWAATEKRFGKHFKALPRAKWSDAQIPIGEYLDLDADARIGKQPFVYTIDAERNLGRLAMSLEMVQLAEERRDFWAMLRELGGIAVSDVVRDQISGDLETEFDQKIQALKVAHEDALAQLKTSYPEMVARRMSDVLLGGDVGFTTVTAPPATPVAVPTAPAAGGNGGAAVAALQEEEAGGGFDPYIDTELCTSCDECTKLNPKMFKYNENKKAYIADPRAGTYQELVTAAERCTARIIHPGTPLNPRERNLDKWKKRAEPFM